MQVASTTDWPNVATACEQANGLLHNPAFFAAIAAHPAFDQDAHGTPATATATPAQIATLMQGLDLTFHVNVFTPRGPLQRIKYFKTQAYTDPAQPDTLFLNSRWLAQQDPSMAEMAATIIHECVHAANATDPAHEFGHGDNSSAGKQNTAPYWIGNYAYSLLSGQPMAALVFDDDAEMVG